jgi:LPXTG-site transpeptidase (sortase) family protein
MTRRRSKDNSRWLWRTLLGFGLACLAAAGVLIALIVTGVWDTENNTVVGASTPFGPTPNLTPEPTPTEALPPGVDAPISSIAIPKFGINAPIQVKGVDADNVMVSPDGPENVAWYDFSGKPGFGSNAVFSGHVDYIDYGPAVFWNIKDLVAGDLIEVHLNEGTVYTYAVESLWSVSAEPTQDELRAVVGPSTNDVVTLITCGGNWDASIQQYDQRTVVRARRVLEPPAPGVTAR